MNNITDQIQEIVKTAMENHLSNTEGLPFLNPDDYRAKTGKRFRMTPDQKARGITREEAFQEFLHKMLEK